MFQRSGETRTGTIKIYRYQMIRDVEDSNALDVMISIPFTDLVTVIQDHLAAHNEIEEPLSESDARSFATSAESIERRKKRQRYDAQVKVVQ